MLQKLLIFVTNRLYIYSTLFRKSIDFRRGLGPTFAEFNIVRSHTVDLDRYL